jgi:valyl-tRNA synthetase
MRLRVLLSIVVAACAATAQKYDGPKPPKPDLPYLKHAETLLPTEAVQAQAQKKKDDTLYTIEGANSPVKTPLAAPILLFDSSKINPESLQLFRLESKNGHRPMQIDKVYEPQRFEPHWAQWWIDSGIFRANPTDPGRVFSLVIPPPNVTGSLHIGHMLEHTEIDVTVRWHRMLGDNTLWLPGTDHAGIATQMVVERKLAEEGIDRRDLGRESSKSASGNGRPVRRQHQAPDDPPGRLLRLVRERFTLDPGLSRAVREVFVRLYEKGLIYRGEYMVNWCPRCQTAISDLEVAHTDRRPPVAHPLPGQRTARPLRHRRHHAARNHAGRYRRRHQRQRRALFDLHGKTVQLPLMDREIPIILDDLADPEFGTGVVKVTPAHDLNDFEAGRRHNLPKIQVIDEDARMTDRRRALRRPRPLRSAQASRGRSRKIGALESVDDYALSLGKCQRCKTPVEPLVSKQWFVKMKPLAEKAIEVVETAHRIHPRQLDQDLLRVDVQHPRLVHLAPALVGPSHSPRGTARSATRPSWRAKRPTACPRCGSALVQDTDVLDTWFSSGLWPFSTLGWPERPSISNTYYPTSLLITGFDILFFWVARMIMLGIEFMGDVPFRQVYIHALVRDAEARRCRRPRATSSTRWWSPRSTAPTPSAWRCCRAPRPAPTSCSPKRAWKARAPSPTRSGTPRASCS